NRHPLPVHAGAFQLGPEHPLTVDDRELGDRPNLLLRRLGPAGQQLPQTHYSHPASRAIPQPTSRPPAANTVHATPASISSPPSRATTPASCAKIGTAVDLNFNLGSPSFRTGYAAMVRTPHFAA